MFKMNFYNDNVTGNSSSNSDILNNNHHDQYIPASPPPSYQSTGNAIIPRLTIQPSAPAMSDLSAINQHRKLSVPSKSSPPLFHHHQGQLSPRPGSKLPRYIYELPYTVRRTICDLLDADGSWKQLGGEYMGLSDMQLTLISHAFFRGGSPTNDLLTKWEQTNPKVHTLFHHLASMHHIRALTLLKPYVSETVNLQYFHNESDSINSTKLDDANIIRKRRDSVNDAIFKRQLSSSHDVSSDSGKNNWSHLGAVGGVDLHYSSNNSLKVSPLLHANDGKNEAIKSEHEVMKKRSFDRSSSVTESLEVSYKELIMGTDGFSEERIIGSGGFGIVYLGELKGTKVAVKRLKGGTGSQSSISQALTELEVLNRYRIDNILPLYGISLDGPEACILYQYMPNGSLSDRLLCECNSNPLTWTQRTVIAEGVAKALNYLHSLKGKPLIHGDVKSANVLLDSQFQPKLGDFGLSRIMTQSESSSSTHITVTSVHGTSVYLPPEYLRQKMLSPAVDVYSYGIVLLEMATGKRAYDGNKLLIDLVEDEITTGNIAQLADPKVQSSLNCHWFQWLIDLGLQCGHKNKKKRPTMSQVLQLFTKYKQTDKANSSESNDSENNLMKITTPLELQMWHDLVKACEQIQPASTVCSTIATQSSLVEMESIKTTTDSHSNSTDENNLKVESSVSQSSRESDDASFIIPLITELGINDKDE